MTFYFKKKVGGICLFLRKNQHLVRMPFYGLKYGRWKRALVTFSLQRQAFNRKYQRNIAK